MPASPLNWLQWLENSHWSLAIRQSTWMYPALEIVHITGIVMLVGPAFLFDLRLLGASKTISISMLERHLLPWSLRAIILVVPSGLLLFITNASALGYDPVFHTKLILILVAALNAWIFHKLLLRKKSTPGWSADLIAPPAAKITAVISLLLWIAVITCGRLLAY